jgi:hypothetical protein
MRNNYTVTTWADGYGRWHARALFTPAIGNTPAAERILYSARDSLRHAIRAAIVERQLPKETRRLSYEVIELKLDSLNRRHALEIAER